MSDEDLDDEPDIADGEEDDGELDLDDDVLVEDVLVEEADVEAVVDDVPDAEAATPARGGKGGGGKRRGGGDDDDDDVVDLEEEHHPDDIEDPLDVLLKEKTVAERLDENEVDEELDDGEPGEKGSNRITPRRADEFLCSSCFLVLPLSQLADGKRQLCRDCV